MVIGVVAAMTVPSIISNYSKKAYVVGLQKSYNSVLQALISIRLNNGVASLKDMDWGVSGTSVGDKTFKSPYEKNIYLLFKEFKGAQYIEPSGAKCRYNRLSLYVDGSSAVNNYDLCPDGGFFAADGVLFAQSGSNLYVDVNGTGKGPNYVGRDIFVFWTDVDKSIVYGRPGWNLNVGYCMSDMTKPQAVWGSYCTARVLAERAMNY